MAHGMVGVGTDSVPVVRFIQYSLCIKIYAIFGGASVWRQTASEEVAGRWL